MFDMNNDHTIEYCELELLFIASCKGLARFLRIDMPNKKCLKEIGIIVFYRCDQNKNYSLEVDE